MSEFNSSRLAIDNHELKAQQEEFVGGADQEFKCILHVHVI